MAELTKIIQYRGSSADWQTLNPVLAEGQIGYETDTRRFKFGDGGTPWNSLPYATNLPALSSAPTGVNYGYQYLDTTENAVKTYTSAGWITALAGTDINLETGNGTPEGSVNAGFGTLYVDKLTGEVYTKQSASGNTGWSKLSIEVNLGTLTEEVISTNQHDWSPVDIDRGRVLVKATANFNVTGIDSTGRSDGDILEIQNTGTGTIRFKRENTNSQPQNRIGTASNFTCGKLQSIRLFWSASNQRWGALSSV